jgi:predicted NBD/HSP70 family sugar kinase
MAQPRRVTNQGRAARQDSLRHHNLALTLRHVLDAPTPVSRADIAGATGLTRATVSALVDRLLDADLIAELVPVAAQRAGRPAVPLVPARGTVAAVGMEINVDYLGVRAIDLGGRVLTERIELGDFRNSRPDSVLDRLASLADPVLALLSADGVRIVGTALALPGVVDDVTGPLRLAPNLGWRDVDVIGLLASDPVLSGMPPRLGNEANLAARAEARVRRGSPASFVYVSGEVGIGGAIVLDGAIWGGPRGWSGEIGHTVLGTTGSFDEGGTLESFAGQDAIVARAGLPRGSTSTDIVAAARVGDPRTLEALEVAGAALGVALANVANIVEVQHVILGGIYAEMAEYLSAPALAQLERRAITAPWAAIELSVARARQYPAMTGAAIEALQTLVEEPALWIGM